MTHYDYHRRLEKFRRANLTKSERMADLIAAWTGSWSFLFLHLLGLILWFFFKLNFNYLTLVVSFEAIVLMNILLMAQNRQALKDELRDEADYQADKNSELEINEIKKIVLEIQKRRK